MKYTIKAFQKEFPDDAACLNYIFNKRYGKDYECKKCKKGKFYRSSKTRKCYSCSWCGFQIHPLAGTPLHKSSTKLTNWFFAIFLSSQSKNGVSGKELERLLGVTYKCAWRISSKVREIMRDDAKLLTGVIEADETYMGGKDRNKHFDKRSHKQGRSTKSKTPVVGMLQRNGIVIAKATADTKRSTVMPLIRQNVIIGSKLYTDEYPVYGNLKKSGYKHRTVNHGEGRYVRGDVHTNSIEGFWSQLKRSVNGTYHSVSPKYLQSYVDEFSFRYNHRDSSCSVFHLLIQNLVGIPKVLSHDGAS